MLNEANPSRRCGFVLFCLTCLLYSSTGCQGPSSGSAGARPESASGADAGAGGEEALDPADANANDITSTGDDSLSTLITEDEEDYGEFAIVASPSPSGLAGEYAFELESRMPGGNGGLTFYWDFGDGDLYEGSSATYTFPAGGTFLVTVTAVTNNGRTAFILTLELEVEMPGQVPVAVPART